MAENLQNNLNLSKTIKLPDPNGGGQELIDFNINAVYSDEAGKVTQPLAINEFSLSGEKQGSYNGSINESTTTVINYVPASGGVFTGDIQIDTPDEDITEQSVLNSRQINNQLELLTGNPLYTWHAGQLLETRDAASHTYKINTIVGTTQDFYIFKNLFSNGTAGLKFTIHNIINTSDYSNAWCEVSSYEGTETTVVIPYIYTYTDNYGYKHDIPVTGIAKSAFTDNKTIVSAVIPSSITQIGERAFKNCTGLKIVELPNSISYIGYETFSGCSSLTNVTIPSSILRIGEKAFYGCTSFTNITIPDTVLHIGESAFYGCSNATQVSIGDGVTVIESSAFGGINTQAYTNDSGLLYLGNAKNPYLYVVTRESGVFPTTINANCKIIGGGFSYNTSLTSITIPEGVTYIGSSAFSGCSNLTTIVIPNSIIGIGVDAFKNCTKLTYNSYENADYLGNTTNPYAVLVKAQATTITSCTIHESTKVISYSAFNGCTNESFSSITIPNGVRSIGEKAFYNCTRFTEIELPDSVEFIDTSAFSSCSAIESVTLGVGLIYIGADAFSSINRADAVLYYTGNNKAWVKVDIIVSMTSTTNTANKNNAFLVKELPEFLESSISPYYNITISDANILNIKIVRNEPFIYICRDIASGAGALDSELNSGNDIYLKLPNDDNIVKVSRGATRLDSVNNTAAVQTYYTYEGLAEIIARINDRLDAIGLKVGSTALADYGAPVLTLSQVNKITPEDIKVEATVTPENIPTITDLARALAKITDGSTWEDGDDPHVLDKVEAVQNFTDSLANVREDLTALETEVLYELAGGETNLGITIDYANSRIDNLEKNLTSESNNRANADKALDNKISALDTKITENISVAINNEIINRTNADTELANQINNIILTEINNIKSGDTTVGQLTNSLTINGKDFNGSDHMIIVTTDADITLSENLYTYVPIGKVQKANADGVIDNEGGSTICDTNPGLLGKGGEHTLKDVFNKIFGTRVTVEPNISVNNTYLGVRTGQTSYGSSTDEIGTIYNTANVTITFTLYNKGTAEYGYRCGDTKYYTQNGKDFYYPVVKQNDADLVITLPANESATVVTDNMGTDANGNSIPNSINISGDDKLYCNFNKNNQVCIEITLPKKETGLSSITLYGKIEAVVKLGKAQKENQLTADTSTEITKFLSYPDGDDAKTTYYYVGGDKDNSAGPYTLAGGRYYSYSTLSTSSTAPTSGATKETNTDCDRVYDYDVGEYLWLYSRSPNKKIQQYISGTWAEALTDCGDPVELSLSSNIEKSATYYAYRTGPFSMKGSARYRLA